MDFAQLSQYINHILTWIGFGTVLGLSAKAILPERDPGGPVALLVMAITGTLIGCALLRYFYPEQQIAPFSVSGFCFGAGGAWVFLIGYRLLGRRVVTELQSARMRRRRQRKRYYEAYED